MNIASMVRITTGLLLLTACGDDDATDTGDTAADTTTAPDTTPGDTADTTPEDTADSTPEDTADTTASDADVVAGPRVALVVDPEGYNAFTVMARAGLARAAAEVSVTDVEVLAGPFDAFEPLDEAAAGSDLVITLGFLYADVVAEVAELHPSVHFAVIDGSGPELPNVSYHEFAVEQGAFLVGAAAALTTQSRRLGFIGGVDIPPIDVFEAGFRAGAAHIALDITVDAARLTRFPDLGGFDDPAAARDEALRMYEDGADVIFHAAGLSGAGLFAAAAERSADHDDVWAIGVDADQYLEVDDTEQPFVLTSMLKRIDEAVYRLVLDFVAGDPPSGYVMGDLAAGMVGYAKSGGHVDAIASQLDALAADIVSGVIVVPTEIPPSCDDLGTGVTSEGWALRAGTPVRRGHSVQGCMVLLRESGAETRGGGLCLVADLNDAHPCETVADCASLPAPPTGGFHYCAAPEGSAAKTCWTRPGGGEYCDRNPIRHPGVIVTPLVPANALPEATEWMVYACLANTANASGCAVGESVYDTGDTLVVPMRQVAFYGGDGNAGDYLGEAAGPGIILEGMTHSLSGAGTTPEFAARIATVDPEAEDLFFAMETYDAVIVAALAAEVARASTGAGVAAQLAAVTTRGQRCTDFAACLALIDAGTDIDYDGLTGPLEMTAGGELARAPYTYVTFGEDNTLDFERAREVIVGDGSLASATTPGAPARDTAATGGALKLGALLPETGPLEFLGPGARAAAELAVADINAAGGVNGVPVELVHADEGSFDDDVILESVETLLDGGVDVVIGAMSSGMSMRVIDTIIAAGVVQISPANTLDAFVDYEDDGLYFRTSPADRMQGRALAELIHRDGHARVAVMALDDDYGLVLSESLERELNALGVTSVLTTRHPYYGPFDDSLDEVTGFDADAIVLLGFDETALIIADLARLGIMPAPRPVAERACRDLNDGDSCDDGDPCTRDTTCSAGWCEGGDALSCGPGEDGASCGGCGGATQACTLSDDGATCGSANVCSPQPNPGCGATSCCQDAAGYQSVCCGLAMTFARRLCTGPGTCAGGGYPCGVGVTATCPEGSAPCVDAPNSCCNLCGAVGPLGCAVCEAESTTYTTRCEVFHDGDGCQAIVE